MCASSKSSPDRWTWKATIPSRIGMPIGTLKEPRPPRRRDRQAHRRAFDRSESRGLLDQTLVVWTSEFGRTSYGQSGNGRDHNPWGYTQWLAGGGVKAGTTFGATDDIGLQSVGKKVDTYDLHATVLQLMGLDHLKTIYLRNGRAERPTVVYGKVVKELLADRSIR